ncbi:hypothetical protein JYK18_41160 [Amycolatopsis sp. 195334CR]|nr:hypothetical protein [Amycolatopsis sp. 195334CR]
MHHAHLRAVAHRLLGSPGEADAAMREARARLERAGVGDPEHLGNWLTAVVARVCIDLLRGHKSDVEQTHEALLADSIGLALVVALDELTSAERLAFVLRDLFAMPYDEIAPIVDRSPAVTRHLTERARSLVRGAALDF